MSKHASKEQILQHTCIVVLLWQKVSGKIDKWQFLIIELFTLTHCRCLVARLIMVAVKNSDIDQYIDHIFEISTGDKSLFMWNLLWHSFRIFNRNHWYHANQYFFHQNFFLSSLTFVRGDVQILIMQSPPSLKTA